MLVFIDETGDHDLIKIDTQYPLFGLGAFVIEETEYEKMDKAISAFKQRYFTDSETFILHSSELKRPIHARSDARNIIMKDADVRARFYKDFDENVVSSFNFKLIFCYIKKEQMADSYRYPADPYHFSFENILNRTIRHGGEKNNIFAEKRGDLLNTELKAEYERLTKVGIRFYDAGRVREGTEFTLVDKKENINGLQFIDMALASVTRAVLGKKEKMVGNDCNPDLLRTKLACPMTFFP
jgi:hypothetical protein